MENQSLNKLATELELNIDNLNFIREGYLHGNCFDQFLSTSSSIQVNHAFRGSLCRVLVEL